MRPLSAALLTENFSLLLISMMPPVAAWASRSLWAVVVSINLRIVALRIVKHVPVFVSIMPAIGLTSAATSEGGDFAEFLDFGMIELNWGCFLLSPATSSANSEIGILPSL